MQRDQSDVFKGYSQQLAEAADELNAAHDLTLVDLNILRALRRVSAAESRWIAGEVGVAPNSMGSRLTSLRRRGLVTRLVGGVGDGMWKITEPGKAVIFQ